MSAGVTGWWWWGGVDHGEGGLVHNYRNMVHYHRSRKTFHLPHTAGYHMNTINNSQAKSGHLHSWSIQCLMHHKSAIPEHTHSESENPWITGFTMP